ncbi:hypothetical protein SAMN05421644_1093 [Allochromatium warmingii]|uniref:Uncharacterized protein n=1 Tax=Allochromatium warmingii TaxID=61595 RepID=A0A1H3DIP6_ALLWA|nr:hypothetical protein [Allochromatium warmingii]SDX66261.1 hypothetical protein SAMN05421644_1093 [Allochromatium warmingii]
MKKITTLTSLDLTSAHNPFRLVFHIGAGKTGTSSIQQMLKNQREQLKAQGVWYLGEMLEHAPLMKFSWQRRGGQAEFFDASVVTRQAELKDVLNLALIDIRNQGFRMAIWSNEWFFPRSDYAINAFAQLQQSGIGIQILAYVRRHDVWARSAYVQWGLKHKGYLGPIRSFPQWYERWKEKGCFMFGLQPWLERFPNAVLVRNFDCVEDVVVDFYQLLGLNEQQVLSFYHVNTTLAPEELLLRTLFNNQVQEASPSPLFQKALTGVNIDYNQTLDDWLGQLMPTRDALEQVLQETQLDRQAVNALLKQSGQPPLVESELNIPPMTVDPSKMLAVLAQITMWQARQITELKDRVNDLAGKLATTCDTAAPKQQAAVKVSPELQQPDPEKYNAHTKSNEIRQDKIWRGKKLNSVIIHVGMQKTGSTALQQVLYHNLVDPNCFYSHIDENHSVRICSLFSDAPEKFPVNQRLARTSTEIDQLNRETLRQLDEELADNPRKTWLFSGEGIGSLKKPELEKFRHFLADRFENIMIVAYVRPPRSFMQSVFQQQLKGGVDNRFNLETKYPRYRRLFEKFDQVYGCEQVQLWKFDPAAFPYSDVVQDFCRRLNIYIPVTPQKVNESLSKQATQLLYIYRRFGQATPIGREAVRINQRLVDALWNIGTDKLRFAPEWVQPILDAHREDIEWMEARLGSSLEEDMTPSAGDIQRDADLLQVEPETLDALKALIGDNAVSDGIKGDTPEEVARLVGCLYTKIAKQVNQTRK